MKLAIHNIALKVKDQIALCKEIIQAQENVGFFKVLHTKFGNYNGKDIFIDDEMVLASTGSRSHIPNAITTPNGLIVMNTAASKLGKDLTEALILHELGHVEFKHTPTAFCPIQASVGFGSGLEMEYQADEYAFLKGAKILDLLEVLSESGLSSRAMRLRIQRLKDLSNIK